MIDSKEKGAAMPRNAYQLVQQHRMKTGGGDSGQIVCPYCQTTGSVQRAQVRVKKGISGGKATAAVMTAGISLLATGLSRKESVTQMHCSNCGTGWTV